MWIHSWCRKSSANEELGAQPSFTAMRQLCWLVRFRLREDHGTDEFAPRDFRVTPANTIVEVDAVLADTPR